MRTDVRQRLCQSVLLLKADRDFSNNVLELRIKNGIMSVACVRRPQAHIRHFGWAGAARAKAPWRARNATATPAIATLSAAGEIIRARSSNRHPTQRAGCGTRCWPPCQPARFTTKSAATRKLTSSSFLLNTALKRLPNDAALGSPQCCLPPRWLYRA